MTQNKTQKGKLAIISGPSGVGKSTICRKVAQKTGAVISVSVTTRPKADSETDGKDYWFVSTDEFRRRIKNGEFLEYAEVFGNFYGTPADKVEQYLTEGKTVILEIDVQGALRVKSAYPDVDMIFLLPPTQKDLAGRMTGRARGENPETAKLRLNTASREIAAAWQYYEHMIINADIEQAANEVIQVLEAKTGAAE